MGAALLAIVVVIVGAAVLIFVVFFGALKLIALSAAVGHAEQMTGKQWLKLILTVAIVAAAIVFLLINNFEQQARPVQSGPTRPSPSSTN